MAVRILLVEDDPRIVLFVGESLEDAGYSVTVARDGEEGFLDARLNDYDLVVLDLTLPTMDGLDVARRLRAVGKAMPILMLTARDREADKIAGLDGGADDYLTKPFRIGELLARVRALLRREGQSRSSAMCVGDLELDTTTRRVVRAGQIVSLSAREYALLHYLVHHVGQTLTRAQLERTVWGDSAVGSNVVEVYIGYLRQKIDAPFAPPLIHTVRGVGYALRAPESP
ncbi:MAG: response regulator transcription factor [Chloroflexota bacterium]|nr:response regulator transcription factor [Chloroflexota bacterium]